MARRHDDAHRPLGGKGKRGNRTTGRPMNLGGAQLVVAPTCPKCGVMMGRYFSAWRCNDCGEQKAA